MLKPIRSSLLAAIAVLLLALPWAPAQSLDVFAGLNALTAQSAIQNIPKLGGGIFPSLGAEVWLGPVGLGAEGALGTRTNAFFKNPIYYDFNLLFSPFSISRSIIPELMLGLGAQHLQDVSGCLSNPSSCDVGGSHLAAHAGLALKMYITYHIFVRPEAHFYFVRHNATFPNAQRFGVSLGYSFGG